MKKALAIDVGGTKIYSAIIDETGKILSEIEKHATPKTLEEIRLTFKNIIKKYESEVDIVAFSTCGEVNNENTKIVGSTGNIAKEYPTLNFSSLSTKPVFVENDANCAAWAEYKIGASKGTSTSVMVTFGTGVGGGIIINNRLFKGKSGAAGAMHFKMYPDKRRKCTCGGWDCFEIYTSGPGLTKTAIEISKNPDITTYDIFDGVKKQDSQMLEIYNRWHRDIIAGFIGLANLFDTECIVLSGSLAQFVDTESVEQKINEEIVTAPTKIYKATAGNYSGMIGAALLAFEKGDLHG